MRHSIRFAVMVLGSQGEFASWCPALRGCWSQGATRVEALANVRSATREYVRAGGWARRRRGDRISRTIQAHDDHS
jgi:hypothetical protein